MLLPYLYKTVSYCTTDNSNYEFVIEINSEDAIFKGHFPFRAILPGVCTIQIIKECICSVFKRELHFMNVDQCKFVGMIDPYLDNILIVKASCKVDIDNNILVNASVFNSNIIVCKLKSSLSEIVK